MKWRLGLILSSLVVIGACVGSHAIPDKNAFGTEEMVFSRGGYEFAARIDGNVLRVRVPCCQTYEADDGFRQNMVRAIEERFGCRSTEYAFTEGWHGPWQLEVPITCDDDALLLLALI
ncbi:MAG: hypothetical protein KKC43_04955 [Alphaproteobacteria bacterium]|nr:hypothetical protein [Alphaproteobacteria bacterium]